MTDGYYFCLPRAEAKKIVVTSGVMFGAIAVGLMVLGRGSVNIVILLALVHLGAYFLLLRHKFLFVSQDGILGESVTGRRVVFAWNDEIQLKEHYRYGISGVVVLRPNQKLLIEAIFVPNAILRSPQFQAIVAKWAPANHVLLSHA